MVAIKDGAARAGATSGIGEGRSRDFTGPATACSGRARTRRRPRESRRSRSTSPTMRRWPMVSPRSCAIDPLVDDAGITISAALEESSVAREALSNVLGMMRTTRAVPPAMRAHHQHESGARPAVLALRWPAGRQRARGGSLPGGVGPRGPRSAPASASSYPWHSPRASTATPPPAPPAPCRRWRVWPTRRSAPSSAGIPASSRPCGGSCRPPGPSGFLVGYTATRLRRAASRSVLGKTTRPLNVVSECRGRIRRFPSGTGVNGHRSRSVASLRPG